MDSTKGVDGYFEDYRGDVAMKWRKRRSFVLTDRIPTRTLDLPWFNTTSTRERRGCPTMEILRVHPGRSYSYMRANCGPTKYNRPVLDIHALVKQPS
jgi:hypothetical protein